MTLIEFGAWTYALAWLFILGTPVLVPIGVGAWAYMGSSSTNRVRFAVCAGAVALVSAVTLGWCMTLHDPVLRFKVTVGAFGVAALATSVLLGMAAVFCWIRGSGLTRATVLATLAAFTCAVGFCNGVILVWGSEL